MSKSNLWCYFVAMIPPFMGAVSYVTSKYVINEISPISLLFFRWIVAVIILTPFLARNFYNDLAIIKSNIGVIFITAISGVTCFNLFLYHALQFTSSTSASIIVSLFPIFVLFLGVIVNKDSLHKTQISAIILSFLGVLIIVTHGNILSEISSLFSNFGDFLALAAAACWAIYTFTVKFKPTDISFYSYIYSTFLIGTILLLPLYLFDLFYLDNSFEPNLTIISVIFCLGFGVSIIGMLSFNSTILKIGPNLSSIFYYLAPLFTAILAIIILDEKIEYFHMVGMALILFGINFPMVVKYFYQTS